jgi:hypothetical protein
MKKSISYLAYKKSPYKSIKHTTYFEVYDALFSPYRGKNITFVEIGVLSGGSLFMWKNFFGPNARIIGIDLNPNAKKWEAHGFEIYIGSQSDENFWSDFIDSVGPIDLVLDDGGHTYEQQIITTKMLLSNINDKGMLVVEDTHTSYMSGFGPKKYSFIQYTKNMIDLINHRFGEFNSINSDNMVWSIRVYESIVAFEINKSALKLKSAPTLNGGSDDHAEDFRYDDDDTIKNLNALGKKFRLIRKIPGYEIIRNFLVYRKFSRKRFFLK